MINILLQIYEKEIPKSGLGFEIGLIGRSNLLDSDVELFTNAHQIPPQYPFLEIAFGSDDPKTTSNKFKGIVNLIKMAGIFDKEIGEYLSYVDFSYSEVSGKSLFCMFPSLKSTSILAPMIPKLIAMLNTFEKDQLLKAFLQFNVNLDQLVNDSKPFYELMLDGALFKIEGKASIKAQEHIFKNCSNLCGCICKEEKSESICEILKYLSLLNVVNTSIELDIKEKIKELIKENPLFKYADIPLKDLKLMFGPSIKTEMVKIPGLPGIVNFLKSGVKSIDILVSLCGKCALKISFNLPGLKAFLDF